MIPCPCITDPPGSSTPTREGFGRLTPTICPAPWDGPAVPVSRRTSSDGRQFVIGSIARRSPPPHRHAIPEYVRLFGLSIKATTKRSQQTLELPRGIPSEPAPAAQVRDRVNKRRQPGPLNDLIFASSVVLVVPFCHLSLSRDKPFNAKHSIRALESRVQGPRLAPTQWVPPLRPPW